MKHAKKRTKKEKARKEGGTFKREKKAPHKHGGGLPEMAVVIVSEINEESAMLAVPEIWTSRRQPPYIVLTQKEGGQALKLGDRVMANLRRAGAHMYKAQAVRVLEAEPPKSVVGLFVPRAGGGVVEPVSRRVKEVYSVAKEDMNGAVEGELVRAVVLPGMQSHGLPRVKIEECLGNARAPRAASLIAAQLHKLPSVFSEGALREAEQAEPPLLSAGREDLRDIPLVTIDGEDARDFDDAVYALPEKDGGFHLIVAIADVAHYVKEHSALDADAFKRGNSAYFPDRVIPMLPERLSNGLCSLKPNEDRYCLAVHLWIDGQGKTTRYQFVRGLMRSHARLTYTQVEQGVEDVKLQPLVENLSAAYRVLNKASDKRGTLAISLPEYKIQFDAAGNVSAIVAKPNLESHKLIEVFMVAANVAAADYLLKGKAAGIYRVHENPTEEKLEELRKFLGLSGYSFPKGAITPHHLNQVLHRSEKDVNAAMIHTAVLRSQMQAYYNEKNLGHFGLGLQYYCHFTSPIRRYSDLVVHRSLAAVIAKGKPYVPENLAEIALHISQSERTAMMAERDAMDRYKISYLSRLPENVFSGAITSLNEHGLFVSLKDTGITGFVPVREFGNDYFLYEPRMSRFVGRQSNRIYKMGDAITVRVLEADVLKGSLIFKPEEKGRKEKREEGKKGKWKGKERDGKRKSGKHN